MQSLQMRGEAVSKPSGSFSADWFELLTVREREIVQQVLSGSSNKEIAGNLGLSVNTVKMHVQNIFVKLGIKRRSQLLSR
jgi:DNA-binding CsgD family transcriptional regulator